MKQWTVTGISLATLTLISLCSSEAGAERESIAARARVARQAGNQGVVDSRSAPFNENFRFARSPQTSGSAVQQERSDHITLPQAVSNSGPRSRVRRQGSQAANPRATTNTKRPLLDYAHDLPLTQMTPEMLENFLASEEDVVILTNCFEDFRTCQSRHATNLIKQLRELGIGGRCKGCSSQEQEHLDQLIYEFIQNFISRYPKYWRRIVPNIGKFLVPRRPDA